MNPDENRLYENKSGNCTPLQGNRVKRKKSGFLFIVLLPSGWYLSSYYKNTLERWAIVALDWYNEPRLGIRWFWGSGGNPFSSAHPTWLIIPSSLTNSILNGLPLNFDFMKKLEKFLSGEMSGEVLIMKEDK